MEIVKAAQLLEQLARQTLEAYANGYGGPEVLERIRGQFKGNNEIEALCEHVERTRAETERGWDSIALGGGAETYFIPEEKEERADKALLKKPDTRQDYPRQEKPKGLRWVGGEVVSFPAKKEEKPKKQSGDLLDQPLTTVSPPEPKPRVEVVKPSLFEVFREAPKAPPNTIGPERLLYPPGLVGHCVQYMIDTSSLPDRKLAVATSIATCAKGIDRKVVTPTGGTTVLFNLVVADTGVGKQPGLNCSEALLHAMELDNVLAASGLESVQAIGEIVEGKGDDIDPNPNVLITIDEVGAWLSWISSAFGVGNVSEIPSELQKLWGLPYEKGWVGSKKVSKKMRKIYGVAFSLLGFSTEDAFFRALKTKHVASGFVNRMLLWNVGAGYTGMWLEPKYHWTMCPKWLGDALKRVATKWPAPPVETPPYARPFPVGWGEGAQEHWREFDHGYRGMPSGEEKELWIRTADNAQRLATVVAVYRGSLVVEMSDLEWGIELAKASTEELKRGMSEYALDEHHQADLVKRIRQEFKQKKVLTIGQIHKLCERLTSDYRKIDIAVTHLAQCQEIIDVKDTEVKPGPKTLRWRWKGA
jgi:hypothetical protein